MAKTTTNSSIRKRQAIFNLILLLCVIVMVNIVGSFKFFRLDLTSENRYTLNPATIDLLKGLEDIVYLKVYLEGDLPANYKGLRNATREMLDDFRAYSPFIEYEFINPSGSDSEAERKAVYQQLLEEGLVYTNPIEEKASGVSQRLIWPGAVVRYRGRSMPLQLLRTQTYANEGELITRSINDLEYEMTNVIRKLQTTTKPRIAFIEGHGELDSLATKDITMGLEEYYTVNRVTLDSNLSKLVIRDAKNDTIRFIPKYSAIIIAKPERPIPEKDKFIIDQFIMRGGKVLWLVDRVVANMDSLSVYSTKLVYPLDLNIDDQLFKYGARINSNLVADLRASVIPLVVGKVGNQPRFEPKRWPYFVLSLPSSNHPIVNNLNATRFEFVSTVDTVTAPGVKKTVLLSTSKRSRDLNTPARISLNILREEPNPRDYPKSGLPLAVLLEGEFQSIYANRITTALRESAEIGFLDKSIKPGAMIVVGDGDVIKNGVSPNNGKIIPLGYDRFTGELFGNRDFLLNCINYLCDDKGLIAVRSREVKLRLLDEPKVKANRTRIQMQNVVLPIGIILLAGLIVTNIRKRKYSKKSK
jgi:ABC-2 type transport system permease protein